MLWQYLREQGAQTAGRKYLPELALCECGRTRKKKIGLCRKARGGSGAVSGLSRGGRKKRCASGWQERCCGGKKYHHRGKRSALPVPGRAGLAYCTAKVGTEELAHLEIVAAIVHQLTRNLTMDEIKASGFAPYYTDHTVGIWPQSAGGVPFNANQFQSSGDPITDLFEDMAAEQKARKTYDNILRLVKDPEVCDPIRFLRAREIVHIQRFGEGLNMVREHLDSKNYYAFNPAFDKNTL